MKHLTTSRALLALFLLTLSFFTLAADQLLLQTEISADIWPTDTDTLEVTLYDAEQGGNELASQAFIKGEWRAIQNAASTSVKANFENLLAPASHKELWMQLQADGKILGPRIQAVHPPVLGVSFALGNVLDLDGNPIINVQNPVNNQDVATKAYVDTSVAGTPDGDITAVIAGTGLSGGASSGDATLDVAIPLILNGSVVAAGVIQGFNTSGSGYGVMGRGLNAGGDFRDTNNSGRATVGSGDFGIDAGGNYVGGFFSDLDGSGVARAGFGDRGIDAQGNEAGGYFKDADSSGYAFVGYGDRGISARGNAAGGHFQDSNSSGYAWVGIGDWGVNGYGNTGGGLFQDSNSSGYAYVGYGDLGISARGNAAGGHFQDSNSSGNAWVGISDWGVNGYGDTGGGLFQDTNSSNFARVGYSTYKIQGSGTVSFVQNHPQNKDEVIVYAAPEGDEIATYTRGTAKLVNGKAVIVLGETFKWVTNPETGLTVHLTPRGAWAGLYTTRITTAEIEVASAPGSAADATFDYIVYGLRIGFEDSSIVQPKQQEAYIPSMDDHREIFKKQPQLRSYSARQRFADMHQQTGMEIMNTGEAAALVEAIGEFDPEIHQLESEHPQPVEEQLD